MTIVERGSHLSLPEASEPLIACPDYRYDLPSFQAEKKDGEGAALIILRNPQSPEILLGLHNSRDTVKHGRWSFIGETRKSGEDTFLATLSRGLEEELNLDLTKLQAGAFKQENIFQAIHGLPRTSAFYSGEKSFSAGIYTLWTEEDFSGEVGTKEIIEAKYFSLKEVLSDDRGFPVREFTLPALHELDAFGLLSPLSTPLRSVQFPV